MKKNKSVDNNHLRPPLNGGLEIVSIDEYFAKSRAQRMKQLLEATPLLSHADLADAKLQQKAEPGKFSRLWNEGETRAADYTNEFLRMFRVTPEEFKQLTETHVNREARNQFLVFLIGVFLTPVSLIGSLFGWVRAYKRIYMGKGLAPQMGYFPPVIRLAMFLGAVLAWVYLVTAIALTLPASWAGRGANNWVLAYLGFNFVFSAIAFSSFKYWWYRTTKQLAEARKFGSARFAEEKELEPLKAEKGFYIGGGYKFSDKGHLMTVGGTRGGKGTNLIIPNLLGAGGFDGSWVVVDPKGENAAITARYQKEQGKNVVILNPWELFVGSTGQGQTYNPLDILADKKSLHLVDDVQMIAEMIVPVEKSADSFWPDTARSIIAGILLHLVVSQKKEKRTLATLWNWVRLEGDDWEGLIADMRLSGDKLYGGIIRNAGNEIMKHRESAETFGSIMSHVLQATDFLKSPALQKTMKSGVDPYKLADGNTVVYIVIPADKLKSHYRWLRLTVTSLMRAVVRKPNKRVAFLLDEFAALGYLPEIETALSTYAGYNITVWPILQSLIQLKQHYGDGWETFAANSAVRHFFNINDNFSAEYISKAVGGSSNMIKDNDGDAWANSRALITPDELRRESGEKIFTFIGSEHPTYFPKFPYYFMNELKGRYDDNPYQKSEPIL